jgi:secreted trypsin-like serine protease
MLRRSPRGSRFRRAAPLAALAVCAGSLVAAGPAQAVAGGSAAPRIVGGEPASATDQWPAAVQLVYASGGTSSTVCGGTLIAPTKVLTAGYCVVGRDWVGSGQVVMRSAHVGAGTGSTVARVRAQWVHPGYKLLAGGVTVDNDLAVLTLARPLTEWFQRTNDTEPGNFSYRPGENPVTIYGWGNTDSSPDSTNAQVSEQQVKLPVTEDAVCAKALTDATGDPNAYVPGHMVCAGDGGTGDDTTGKAACVGDEGDTVLGQILVGVVSHVGVRTATQDCNIPGLPTVFTNTRTYVGDIRTQIYSTDATRDGKADILARTPAGGSYLYTSTGTGYKQRVPAPISFANYNTVVQADLDLDGYQDYVLRASGTGNVFVAKRTAASATYKYTLIGRNWQAVKAITVPGDVDGNRYPDLEVEDSSGRLWTYGGIGDGLFSKPYANQTNLKAFNAVVGHGDFNNDGFQDLLAREAATGKLYLVPGTPGNWYIRYLTPEPISGGWNGYNKLDAVGDYDGDGHPDLLARTPSGALFLHRGTGLSGTKTFAPAIRLGYGWQMYNLMG